MKKNHFIIIANFKEANLLPNQKAEIIGDFIKLHCIKPSNISTAIALGKDVLTKLPIIDRDEKEINVEINIEFMNE